MKRNILASVTFLITVILIYSSCTRVDTTDLGNDLIPVVDNVETFDTTLDVITDNFFTGDDTSTMLYTELHTVGIINNDAEFGRTEGHMYSSFLPSASHTYPFIKKDTVRIDSVVLSLSFNGLYGDSTSEQNFEVREIKPSFGFVGGNKINIPDVPVNSQLLGNRTVFFYTLNDLAVHKNIRDTVRNENELRIRLDTSWARRFVNYDTTKNSAYNNDSIFLTNFRGLEIRANESSPVQRALAYFNINDNNKTRITFYCRIQNNGRTDTITPYFIYSGGRPDANIVRRTPANGYLANINNGIDNDQKLYIQSTPGSNVTVKIPGLNNLSNRVIHRAELIGEIVPSAEENLYTAPPSMFIEALSTTGDSLFTIRNDFVLTNADPGYDVNTLGGLRKNNIYRFNLTRYVQSIVTKKLTNYTLRITSPFTVQPHFLTPDDVPFTRIPIVINSFIGGGRVVLYGGNFPDSAKKMKLRIIYSKI